MIGRDGEARRTPPVDPLASNAHTGRSGPYILMNFRFENSNPARHFFLLPKPREYLERTCIEPTTCPKFSHEYRQSPSQTIMKPHPAYAGISLATVTLRHQEPRISFFPPIGDK